MVVSHQRGYLVLLCCNRAGNWGFCDRVISAKILYRYLQLELTIIQMPISLRWDDTNKTILRLTFWNEWVLDEFVESFHEALALLKSLPHNIDILIDLRIGSYIPNGNIMLRYFRYMMDNLPDNVGTIVYINDDPVQQHHFHTQVHVYYSVRKRQRRRVFMVETAEQAYILFEKQRVGRG